jgi:hypothetical protein
MTLDIEDVTKEQTTLEQEPCEFYSTRLAILYIFMCAKYAISMFGSLPALGLYNSPWACILTEMQI